MPEGQHCQRPGDPQSEGTTQLETAVRMGRGRTDRTRRRTDRGCEQSLIVQIDDAVATERAPRAGPAAGVRQDVTAQELRASLWMQVATPK